MEWEGGPSAFPPAVAAGIDVLIVLRRGSGKGSGGDEVGRRSWKKFLISITNMARASSSSTRIPLTGAGNGWRSSLKSWGRSGLRIHFWFQSRIKDILRDEDLIPEMKRLGLYEVMLGIESIQPDVLNRYEKQQSREMAQKAIDILRKK